jgi:hypothetical protein
VPRWTAKAPPPYSCTRVRTFVPAGRTSAGEEKASARTSATRPSSSGRVSVQYTSPSSNRVDPSRIDELASIAGVTGEDQLPYGATRGSVTPDADRRSHA